MKLLEDKIIEKGKVLEGNILKVGSFLNQQMDAKFITELGKEIYNHFKDKNVNKILTAEASGIAFAIVVAQFFNCKMTFAKKMQSIESNGEVYSAECTSYTRKIVTNFTVPKDCLNKDDNILIVDDFLAIGNASNALRDIVKQSGAKLVGYSSIIEKGFQGGGDKMRAEGIDVFSLAIVDEMNGNRIVFRKQ